MYSILLLICGNPAMQSPGDELHGYYMRLMNPMAICSFEYSLNGASRSYDGKTKASISEHAEVLRANDKWRITTKRTTEWYNKTKRTSFLASQGLLTPTSFLTYVSSDQSENKYAVFGKLNSVEDSDKRAFYERDFAMLTVGIVPFNNGVLLSSIIQESQIVKSTERLRGEKCDVYTATSKWGVSVFSFRHADGALLKIEFIKVDSSWMGTNTLKGLGVMQLTM